MKLIADPVDHVIDGPAMERAFTSKASNLLSYMGTRRAEGIFLVCQVKPMRIDAIKASFAKYTAAILMPVMNDFYAGMRDGGEMEVFVTKNQNPATKVWEYDLTTTVPYGLIMDDKAARSKNFFEYRVGRKDNTKALEEDLRVQERVMREDPGAFGGAVKPTEPKKRRVEEGEFDKQQTLDALGFKAVVGEGTAEVKVALGEVKAAIAEGTSEVKASIGEVKAAIAEGTSEVKASIGEAKTAVFAQMKVEISSVVVENRDFQEKQGVALDRVVDVLETIHEKQQERVDTVLEAMEFNQEEFKAGIDGVMGVTEEVKDLVDKTVKPLVKNNQALTQKATHENKLRHKMMGRLGSFQRMANKPVRGEIESLKHEKSRFLIGLGTRMEKVEARMGGLEVKVESLEVKVDHINTRLDTMENLLVDIRDNM